MKKLECSKQARLGDSTLPLNSLAWDNRIGLCVSVVLVGFLRCAVMINRNSWGHWYFVVRGEILRLTKDPHRRKHLPRMFPLIKNKSLGIEDDQIPS